MRQRMFYLRRSIPMVVARLSFPPFGQNTSDMPLLLRNGRGLHRSLVCFARILSQTSVQIEKRQYLCHRLPD